MRTIILFLVSFLLFWKVGFSQSYEISLVERALKSSVIFEEKVIRSDSYLNQAENFIYTSHTVEISKIFKSYGYFDCGTVEIITRGGRVGDRILDISHNLELREGNIGLFFCIENDFELPSTDFYSETNATAFRVYAGEQGFIGYYFDGVNPAAADLYAQYDSLAQLYNLVELQTQLTYIECNAPILPNLNDTHSTLKQNVEPYLFPQYSEIEINNVLQNIQLKNDNAKLNGTNVTKLTYTIENEHITGTSPKYLEFDIYLKADDNTSFLDNAMARLEYDTNAFGTYIQGNSKIEVTRLLVTADTVAYPTIIPVDNLANTVDIYMVGLIDHDTLTAPNPNRFQIQTIGLPAVHVKMEYVDCLTPSSAYFIAGNQMQINSIYTTSANTSSNFLFQYPSIQAVDYLTISCDAQLTGFSPAIVRAGVGDTLKVFGQNLGNTKGDLFFPNADDGGATKIKLNDSDILTWTDSVITLTVPSVVDSVPVTGASGIQYKRRAPGSGELAVRAAGSLIADSTVLYSQPLEILFGYLNLTLNNQKLPLQLYNRDGNGGYNFRIDTALVNQPYIDGIVSKSIREWQCLSGVNFKRGLPLAPPSNIGLDDTLDMIQYGVMPDTGTIMQTYKWQLICFDTINSVVETKLLRSNIDIVISNTESYWLYDTTGTQNVPQNHKDFYHSLLHELGHAHGFTHRNDTLSVMYFTERSNLGVLPANQRAIYLNMDNSVVVGANYMVVDAITDTLNCGGMMRLPMVKLPPCGINSIEYTTNTYPLKVYPNPATDKLRLEIDNPLVGQVKIELIDVLGRANNPIYLPKKEYLFSTSIGIENLPAGIYFIRLYFDNQVFNAKFIKQ